MIYIITSIALFIFGLFKPGKLISVVSLALSSMTMIVCLILYCNGHYSTNNLRDNIYVKVIDKYVAVDVYNYTKDTNDVAFRNVYIVEAELVKYVSGIPYYYSAKKEVYVQKIRTTKYFFPLVKVGTYQNVVVKSLISWWVVVYMVALNLTLLFYWLYYKDFIG